MRGYTTPPYMFFEPGNDPRSSRITEWPLRASTVAAADPAGPAPTTIASTAGVAYASVTRRPPATVGRATPIVGIEQAEEFVEGLVGVGHDGEIGHRHHRTVRVGVDADDVIGVTEAAGVLHRTADAERQIQLGVDHHAGGADLAVVVHPRAVGDHPGGAHHAADRAGEPVELGEAFVALEPCAATDDPAGLGEIHRLHVGWQHLDDDGVVGVDRGSVTVDVDAVHRGGRVEGEAAAGTRLHGGHEGPGRTQFVELEPATACDADPVGAHLGGAGEQRTFECAGETGSEIASVGSVREHDDVAVGQ